MAGFSKLKRAGLYTAITMVSLLIMAVGLLLFQFWLFLRVPAKAAYGVHVVEIRPGTSAAGVALLLRENGIISDAKMFQMLCRYRNAGHRLQAGEYAFFSPSTPDRVLDRIVQGKTLTYRVTLPEGSNLHDIARIVEEQGLAPAEEILALSRNAEFIASLGLSASSLEGYLFPETYQFRRDESAPSILAAMVQQFRRRFPEDWQHRATELGLSIHQVVVVASMVEKEAVVDSERPLIAAVFYNRLKKGMPLQSDPTAVYDLAGFSGTVTPAHLKRQSPYNTYHIRGLPPGPICSPGAGSLYAALYPRDTPYLYFVSNNNGTHQFSETFSEHRKAVSHQRGKRGTLHEEALPVSRSDPATHGIGVLEKAEDRRREAKTE